MNVPSRLPRKDQITMTVKLKYTTLLLAEFISMLALSSCREELSMEENKSDGKISFHIQSDSELQTKSSGHSISTDYEICGETMTISLTTSDNTDCIHTEDIGTRGPAFDNSDEHQITAISVTSILADGSGGKLYFTEDVDVDGGCGVVDRFWPETPLSFFAYSVSKDNVTIIPAFKRENNQCIGSFSYALPTAAETSPRNDATAQPDVVFAITPDLTRPADGCVDLEFHHALSALVFKVGKMPTDVILNSITIKGVYSSGICNMTVDSERDVTFEWTYDERELQDATYTEEIGKLAITGEQIGGEEAVFMMLPQDLSEDATLQLSFTYRGEDASFEKNFKEIIESWEADHKYEFTIGIPSGVEVEVDDKVSADQTVKSDLRITNTGLEDIYVRAMLHGEWVTGSGDDEVVIACWSIDRDGTFIGFNTADWLYSSVDGYYYYIHPLKVGYDAIDLFDRYEVNTVPPVIGTELRLSVVSQAVALRDPA